MINVKDGVYTALSNVIENISDSYPKNWATLPAVQYCEEENKVFEYTDNKEQKAYVRYRIDIWDNRSTSQAAIQVDDAISDLGLLRIQCMDVEDPSGLKHKQMRYEMIIDLNTRQVYHGSM